MTPAEAIRRAENIVLKDYQTFSTAEAREIMAGLLKAVVALALKVEVRTSITDIVEKKPTRGKK